MALDPPSETEKQKSTEGTEEKVPKTMNLKETIRNISEGGSAQDMLEKLMGCKITESMTNKEDEEAVKEANRRLREVGRAADNGARAADQTKKRQEHLKRMEEMPRQKKKCLNLLNEYKREGKKIPAIGPLGNLYRKDLKKWMEKTGKPKPVGEELQEWIDRWGDKKKAEWEGEGSFEQVKTWKRIDEEIYEYKPLGKWIVDLGGWKDPSAREGACTGALQCMIMGDPYVIIHPQTNMMEFAHVKIRWREQFTNSWSETMKYYMDDKKQSNAEGNDPEDDDAEDDDDDEKDEKDKKDAHDGKDGKDKKKEKADKSDEKSKKDKREKEKKDGDRKAEKRKKEDESSEDEGKKETKERKKEKKDEESDDEEKGGKESKQGKKDEKQGNEGKGENSEKKTTKSTKEDNKNDVDTDKKKTEKLVRDALKLKDQLNSALATAEILQAEIRDPQGGAYAWAKNNAGGDQVIARRVKNVREGLSTWARRFLVTKKYDIKKDKNGKEVVILEMQKFVRLKAKVDRLTDFCERFNQSTQLLETDSSDENDKRVDD